MRRAGWPTSAPMSSRSSLPGGDPSRCSLPLPAVEDPERSSPLSTQTPTSAASFSISRAIRRSEDISNPVGFGQSLRRGHPVGWLEESVSPTIVLREIIPPGNRLPDPIWPDWPQPPLQRQRRHRQCIGRFPLAQGDNKKAPCTAPAIGVPNRRRDGGGTWPSRGFATLDAPAPGSGSTFHFRRRSPSPTAARLRAIAGRTVWRSGPGQGLGGAGTNIYRCKDGKYVHFTTNRPTCGANSLKTG